MSELTLTDESNNVTLHVSVDAEAKVIRIELPRFEGVPVVATLIVPLKSAEKAIRSFATDLYANEDVIANLLREALKRM